MIHTILGRAVVNVIKPATGSGRTISLSSQPLACVHFHRQRLPAVSRPVFSDFLGIERQDRDIIQTHSQTNIPPPTRPVDYRPFTNSSGKLSEAL